MLLLALREEISWPVLPLPSQIDESGGGGRVRGRGEGGREGKGKRKIRDTQSSTHMEYKPVY